MEQELRDIYYSPKTGYQSGERLNHKAMNKAILVTRKQVKEWLKSQDTYTAYKQIVRMHKFKLTHVNYLGKQTQMDLVDMGKYKNQNRWY